MREIKFRAWNSWDEKMKLKEKLRYKCPSCGQETLMIDSVGFVICSLIGCKEPDAFHKMVMK